MQINKQILFYLLILLHIIILILGAFIAFIVFFVMLFWDTTIDFEGFIYIILALDLFIAWFIFNIFSIKTYKKFLNNIKPAFVDLLVLGISAFFNLFILYFFSLLFIKG